MKVLFIVPNCPYPAFSGNDHLTSSILRVLSNSHFNNSICSIDLVIISDRGSVIDCEAIKSQFKIIDNIFIFYKLGKIQTFFFRLIFFFFLFHHALGRFYLPKLAKWLVINANNYEFVHFDTVQVSHYIRYIGEVNSLLVSSDAYSMAACNAKNSIDSIFSLRRLYLSMQEFWFKNYEKKIYPIFDIVCVVGKDDLNWLKNINNNINLKQIGIGLPTERESILNRSERTLVRVSKILILGSLNHKIIVKSILDFLYRIEPQIDNIISNIYILGRDPDIGILNFINKHKNKVFHIEYVDNYLDFLNDDWIVVYPQKIGSGLQTKIQQAMSMGLPVIGFPVAFGGILVESGVDSFQVKNINSMIQALKLLESSFYIRKNIGEMAKVVIELQFNDAEIYNKISSAYTFIGSKKRL